MTKYRGVGPIGRSSDDEYRGPVNRDCFRSGLRKGLEIPPSTRGLYTEPRPRVPISFPRYKSFMVRNIVLLSDVVPATDHDFISQSENPTTETRGRVSDSQIQSPRLKIVVWSFREWLY